MLSSVESEIEYPEQRGDYILDIVVVGEIMNLSSCYNFQDRTGSIGWLPVLSLECPLRRSVQTILLIHIIFPPT